MAERQSDGAAASDLVWYLYGITRWHVAGQSAEGILGLDGSSRVQMLRLGDLAAAVSEVRAEEFAGEAFRQRLQDPAWLEPIVRGHERVVEAIHREYSVLPCKLGSVYATQADVMSAIDSIQAVLLAQLARVAGCDEWGLRLYADRSVVRERVAREHPEVQRLQTDLANSRPGHAYFLARRTAATAEAAAEQAMTELAQAAFERLRGLAVAADVTAHGDERAVAARSSEILRAAFLVERASGSRFENEIRRFTEAQDGLHSEYSGPWPPYSFVRLGGERETGRGIAAETIGGGLEA